MELVSVYLRSDTGQQSRCRCVIMSCCLPVLDSVTDPFPPQTGQLSHFLLVLEQARSIHFFCIVLAPGLILSRVRNRSLR
jgi:hypothetical protein